MLIRNATKEQITEALARLNVDYDGNLQFNNFTRNGKGWRVTLRVADSRGSGARLGFPSYQTGKQRHLINACWHAHGEFFDDLLIIAPEVVIKAGTITIDKNGGNWQDRNIGSMMQPMFFSEACNC